jgi:hypothetical protein
MVGKFFPKMEKKFQNKLVLGLRDSQEFGLNPRQPALETLSIERTPLKVSS